MSIAQTVVLRYRETGYLRFDIPKVLCTPEASSELTQGLESVDGVYRVGIQANAGKLAIRFHDAFCSFETLVRFLLQLVKRIAQKAEASRPSRSTDLIVAGPRRSLPNNTGMNLPAAAIHWLKMKVEEIRETVYALRILISRFFGTQPRWSKEFMNDLLMLFLIKLHWHQILTEWLPRPWTYRYEWMATIYMIYLSVQSKVPQAA